MAHATALVPDDATTHACWKGGCPCSCSKLAAAGWKVNCAACGRKEFAAGELGVTALLGTQNSLVEIADDEDEPWSSIEPCDVAGDDRLVDEAERRVA